jgi:hypothetical protein
MTAGPRDHESGAPAGAAMTASLRDHESGSRVSGGKR